MNAPWPTQVWRGAEYVECFQRMQRFTALRTADTPDELWVCEHLPVYTQGLAGKPEHLLGSSDIAVIQSNRGGQITYHGPGQVVAYPLLDLRRRAYFVKEYVYRIEEAVIRTLATFGVTGHRVPKAPGIYVRLDDPYGHARLGPDISASHFVGMGKIAALGIKVSQHCTTHGVALNVAMDLSPFEHINPCGYAGLQSVDLRKIGIEVEWGEVAQLLSDKLAIHLA